MRQAASRRLISPHPGPPAIELSKIPERHPSSPSPCGAGRGLGRGASWEIRMVLLSPAPSSLGEEREKSRSVRLVHSLIQWQWSLGERENCSPALVADRIAPDARKDSASSAPAGVKKQVVWPIASAILLNVGWPRPFRTYKPDWLGGLLWGGFVSRPVLPPGGGNWNKQKQNRRTA